MLGLIVAVVHLTLLPDNHSVKLLPHDGLNSLLLIFHHISTQNCVVDDVSSKGIEQQVEKESQNCLMNLEIILRRVKVDTPENHRVNEVNWQYKLPKRYERSNQTQKQEYMYSTGTAILFH